MDDAVLRSLARWPNVPACFGWLSLDRQGRWRLQDTVVTHRGFAEFIGRNYQCDEAGRWFFQNGPQRVFVRLDYTPWVFGRDLSDASRLLTHTGRPVTPQTGWVDESGAVLIESDAGIGLLASQDLVALSDALELDDDLRHGWLTLGVHRLKLAPIESGDVPKRFGFDPSPCE
ncbi:DUF2946 family protein [Niveibacterium umoris]|uniref:DUF2946 domain-containing protein n=1 Tax=Niveibacterium umoris TaxID=1193620 RepID=A0A840BHY0_9RHOO|nr:hypothetical protein [Niveibacterium umoris]